MSDPLRRLWEALEAHGYEPRGTECQFRARCPGHQGDNHTSLSVNMGAVGRAVVYCYAHQCKVEAIVAALGLSVADLFPDGHRRGHRHPLRRLKRSDFTGTALDIVNVVFALEKLGEPWQLTIGCTCPYCGSPGGWLRALPGSVSADCELGCDENEWVRALLGRLEGLEAK